MSNMFKGENWEVVSTRRAKEIAKKRGHSESLWELFLFEANQDMIKEVLSAEKIKKED